MALSKSGFLTIICLLPFVVYLSFRSKNNKQLLVSFAVFCILATGTLHILASQNSKVWDESLGAIIKTNPYADEEVVITTIESKWEIPSILGSTVNAKENQFTLPELPESGVGPGSGRLFIWENTFTLVMKRPLFGYGLDTLMYNFPHTHIDLRANLETETVIVDKPHNMYIGVFYGTGIIGFIGFMGIILSSVFIALKMVIPFKASINFITVLALGWLAYLFQSLFNDTLPGTAAPLWILAGLMIGIFYKKKNELLRN